LEIDLSWLDQYRQELRFVRITLPHQAVAVAVALEYIKKYFHPLSMAAKTTLDKLDTQHYLIQMVLLEHMYVV
jgi:23S rRNA pseudoU1915 N3-methylase RlmH